MKKIILPLLSILIFLPNVDARFWTNKEGKSFEGELVEVKDNAVTIRRASDRIKFTVNVADLSQGDQEYLKKLEEDEDNKNESSDVSLPSTPKELAKWLAGTEWRLTEDDQDKAIRFLSESMTETQQNTKKWDKKLPGNIKSYKIESANSIKFSINKNSVATFNKDFTQMTYISSKGKTGRGKLISRFIEEPKADQLHAEKIPEAKKYSHLPTTKEELEKWIIGTEWTMFDNNTDKVRRFLPYGLLLHQGGNSKWDDSAKTEEKRYEILSPNTMKFAKHMKWVGTFSVDYTKISYVSPEGKKGQARLIRRFQ